MKAAYFHCMGGVSGDMVLGALVDAGVPLAQLASEVSKVRLEGYRLEAARDRRGGLWGTRVRVLLDESVLQTKERRLGDILDLISSSSLSPSVKERASAVFRRLAQAEARVHATSEEEVHFHEVGAVDAIVDIVGAAAGIELLGAGQVYCSAIPGGGGAASTAHGTVAVPAPATLELLAMARAPLRATSRPEVELSTPTGVAIMSALATFEEPVIHVEKVGYGLGQKDLGDYPNALAMWLGDLEESTTTRRLMLLETNIDNMNPELYSYVMDRLFQDGARDVWFTPIQMKKGRPGVMLSVLAIPQAERALVEVVLKETSSLGVRVREVRRYEADRETKTFSSSLGRVSVKLKLVDGRAVAVSPEYEACRSVALERGLPLQEVYRIVTAEAGERFLGQGP